jgi:hypothetical protein
MRFSFLAIGLFASSIVWAQDAKFELSGSARVRAEAHDNSDFSGSAKDYTDYVGSRFRLDLKVRVNEKALVFVQPQFSKIWGEPEYVPSSATGNTSTNTSGATNDTPLDVHQAYLSYAQTESFSYLIGRREMNYGDELLVGGVGWSNTGRSFDLVQANFKYGPGSVEAFHSRVVDRNVSAAGLGDRDFSGLYSSNKVADWMQAADAYVFYLDDPSTGPAASTAAYGVRVKSPAGAFDYRAEATFERVKAATKSDERQYDVELGYTVFAGKSIRVAGEYFHASENFDQLFPTGHKWLGYADLFSRRNIEGYRGRVSAKPIPDLTASIDYHRFQRAETDTSAYKFGGTAYGTAGTDSHIGDEFDLVLGYKVDENVTLEGGAARVMPGDYLKANGGSDYASFYYLQIGMGF